MGTALATARETLRHLEGKMRLTYAAVYTAGEKTDPNVLVFEHVPQPRVFEWNLFHHPVMRTACVDIDGVLCHDPDPEENDDSGRYLEFLLSARRRFVPTQTIGYLVTSRLERYRSETEAWLAKQNVAYGKLVMLDLPDAETRRRQGSHGRFKGEYYRRANSPLFIESEPHQAAEIARISGKDVLCTADQTIYRPNTMSPLPVAQSVRHQDYRRIVKRIVGPGIAKRIKNLISS
jgi:uncharacterized HAD superfamily protein